MSENHDHERKPAAVETTAAVQTSKTKPRRRHRPRQKPQDGIVNGEGSKPVNPDQSGTSVDDQASSSAPAKKPSRRRRKGGNKKNEETTKADGVDSKPEEASGAASASVDHSTPTLRTPKSRFNKNRAQAQLTTETADVPVVNNLPSSSNPAAVSKKRNNTRRSRNQNSRISQLKEDEIKDLLTSLTHGLTTSTYDCMICWDIVRPGHQTWSCDCCWAVFHLGCVQTWATKSLHGMCYFS
jgi:transcriptional repressor NF-X1